jgi:uncharacterized membrane-anchored protein YhcB (DUF1043 family)
MAGIGLVCGLLVAFVVMRFAASKLDPLAALRLE